MPSEVVSDALHLVRITVVADLPVVAVVAEDAADVPLALLRRQLGPPGDVLVVGVPERLLPGLRPVVPLLADRADPALLLQEADPLVLRQPVRRESPRRGGRDAVLERLHREVHRGADSRDVR